MPRHSSERLHRITVRIPNLYIEQALAIGQALSLPDAAHQHLVKVLRMNVGDSVRLFNGSGQFYLARLSETGKKASTVVIDSVEPATSESSLHTHLGLVISRGDRMDYAIQKSTELGVSEITPLFSERCEVRLDQNRTDKRGAHWQEIAINAAEQCGRSSVPRVHPAQPLNLWLVEQPTDSQRLVLHHRDTQQLTSLPTPTHVTLLIGPEGGLSDLEISSACAQGFIPTTLGPRVLRTETAPVTALSIVQWLWGDFQKNSHSQDSP